MSPKEQHISKTYESEKDRLTGFIRKRVSSDEDAEDISQDVFLSLSTGFDDILNLSNTLSWIYSVAKKKIIDFKRKKKNFRLEDQQQLVFDGDEPLLIADIIPAIESLPDDKMMEDLNGSVTESRKYHTEIKKLGKRLESLNNVYGNMLAAMNVKVE